MNNKLPVIDTFSEALDLPRKHYRELLRIGAPAIATGLLVVIATYLPLSGNWASAFEILFFPIAISYVLSLLVAIVGCHRIFLLGESVVSESKVLHWAGNGINYVGWWIWIGLCACVIALPMTFLVIPAVMKGLSSVPNVYTTAILIMNIPLLYVVSRWSMVLPACAIDVHGKSLTWSWELSMGNGWRLALLIGILPATVDMIFGLLPDFDSIFFTLFYGGLWLVVGVVEVGLLSLSYKFLAANEGSPEIGNI